MGAWGDSPKDNDGSADLFDAVCRKSATEIEKKFFSVKPRDSSDQWDRVGLIQYVIEEMPGCVRYLQDVLKTAVGDLDDIIQDKDFLNQWRDPSSTRKHALKLRRQIENILSKM